MLHPQPLLSHHFFLLAPCPSGSSLQRSLRPLESWRKQSAANTRLGPLPQEQRHTPESHSEDLLCWAVIGITAGEYSGDPGGQQQLKPVSWSRGWCQCSGTGSLRETTKQNLSCRNILPKPCVSSETSCTAMKGLNQLSLPSTCVNQHLYKNPGSVCFAWSRAISLPP